MVGTNSPFKLGFRNNVCALVRSQHPTNKCTANGVMCFHVDDMLGTRDDHFESKMKELDKLVGFGSMKRYKIRQREKTCQRRNHDLMKGYVRNLKKTGLTLRCAQQLNDNLSTRRKS